MKTIGAYVKRVRALGWPFLLTGLAFILGVIALTQPVWGTQQTTPGGDVDRWTYGWTVVTLEQWQGGSWSGTTVMPYTSPNFSDYRVRDAVTTAYAVATAYVISLFALGLLQMLGRSRKIPQNLRFLATLAPLILGAAATGYSVFAIPGAANLDVNSAINGFSGSTFVNGPGSNDYTLSWGGAAGWWMWLGATILSLVVFIVPVLQRKPWSRATPAH